MLNVSAVVLVRLQTCTNGVRKLENCFRRIWNFGWNSWFQSFYEKASDFFNNPVFKFVGSRKLCYISRYEKMADLSFFMDTWVLVCVLVISSWDREFQNLGSTFRWSYGNFLCRRLTWLEAKILAALVQWTNVRERLVASIKACWPLADASLLSSTELRMFLIG